MVNRFDKFAIDVYNWIIVTVITIFVYIIFTIDEKQRQSFKDLRGKVKRELLGDKDV